MKELRETYNTHVKRMIDSEGSIHHVKLMYETIYKLKVDFQFTTTSPVPVEE